MYCTDTRALREIQEQHKTFVTAFNCQRPISKADLSTPAQAGDGLDAQKFPKLILNTAAITTVICITPSDHVSIAKNSSKCM